MKPNLKDVPKLTPDKDGYIVYSFAGFVSYHDSIIKWCKEFKASLRAMSNNPEELCQELINTSDDTTMEGIIQLFIEREILGDEEG